MSSYAHAGAASGASSSTAGTTASGFPLRTNFFRSLALSKETVAALYGEAKQNAAICLHQSFNEQWRYVPPEKDGTQLRKDTSNLATSCRFVRAATVLRCQEHELNLVMANTNNDSWREFMRKCFGKHYIDTMILHSFSGADAAKDASDNNRAHRAASDRPADASRATLWKLHGGVDTESDGAATDDGQDTGARRNSDTQSLASDDDTMTTMTVTPGDGVASDEPPQELLTIKWGAFDTGGQGKRDLCVLDYLTTTTLPNNENSTTPNERVYMWCFSSVEGERVGCMALKDTHSIARASLSKLAVFWRRVSDEETEVIMCGSFASKHAKYVSAIFLQSLHRLQGIVEDLRLSNQIYIQNRNTWVKDHERSSCHLCMRNFYALRRKHHCRKCGEVICSDCSVVENVDLPVIGYSKLRLCKVCCLKAKSTPLKRSNDKANVFDHLVRARSLSNVHLPEPSPYNARMSFAESHSGSGSGGERDDRGNNNLHHHHCHHQAPHHSSNNQHYHQQSSSAPTATLHQQAVASSVAALRAELFVEATSRSSSSFSSSNTNDFELTDSLDDYVTMQQQQQQTGPPPPPPYYAQPPVASSSSSSSAAVHPMIAKELRGLSSTATSSSSGSTTTTATTMAASSSTASSTPMLAGGGHDNDDDFDDFIDMRTLNKQLCAMEQKQQASNKTTAATTTTRSTNSNMFDLLCELACQTLGCPIASVSIQDGHGESIRSAAGLLDKPELHDELLLFIDKVMGSTPTIVLDANVDKQVSSLFTRRGAPQIRFFAGCPIHSRTGKKLGYVCVADFTKRDTLGASCAFTMERLATLAVTTMERNIASGKQPPPQPSQSQQPSSHETYTHTHSNGYTGNGYTSNNNQTSHHHHPTAIFDRPATGPGSAPQPRHRQSNAAHPPPVSHHNYQSPPQYHSAAQAYQYQDAYPVGAVHTARVYEVAECDEPVAVGSPVAYHHHHHHHTGGGRGPVPSSYHAQPSPAPPANGVPPVAPLPRQYNEYSAGYYEAQERMRKLLIKSYNTSQQLATGSTPLGPSAPTSAAYQSQY
jgi:hypothetical protein